MYLSLVKYFWRDEQEKPDELQKLVTLFTSKGNKIFEDMQDYKLNSLKFEVGYWRKANQIHKWFVENVQHNDDDCGDYDVDLEKLKELLNIVKKILKTKDKKEKNKLAKELLPTEEGSSFGGLSYDIYYFQQLKDTKEIIEKLLKVKNLKDYNIEYRSSW